MRINQIKPAWTLFWRHFKPALSSPSRMTGLAFRIFSLLKARGLRGALEKFSHRAELYDEYPRWVALYDTPTSQNLTHMRAQVARLNLTPRFSLLIWLGAAPDRQTMRTIESVQAQIYPHWEIRITCPAESETPFHIKLQVLANAEPRISILSANSQTEALNTALDAATGEWICLLDPSCEIPQHALYRFAEDLADHPDVDILYSDEDHIDPDGRRSTPCFKPDWNPDLLLSHNYIGSLACYRTETLRQAGGFRAEAEGAMAWDLALRLCDAAPHGRIRHIPHILCHRHTEGAAPPPDHEAEHRILQAHLRRKEIRATATLEKSGYWRIRHTLPTQPPLVSIIIPTRNGLELLSQCIKSVRDKTVYASFEIIVVDNQSDDGLTLEYLRQLEQNGSARVLRHDAPFNYAAINNFAVDHAHGEFLCLLNNDIEVIHADWLEELVSLAARPEAGAVGAMLYYPDGTVQHAGIMLAGIEDITAHLFAHLPAAMLKNRPRAKTMQNLAAITGACLVVEKKKFIEIGGFDEQLAVTYNDIDLCLRLRAKGYRNTWTPFAELYHHESATRGFDDSFASQARFSREKAFMIKRWGTTLNYDPAYNPNLDPKRGNYALSFRPEL